MCVKNLILRQLEEKCSLLKSRMERTSRLIQQHRDTYAELYEEREEVKRALDIMKSLPSIGPINHHIPKLGDVCEVQLVRVSGVRAHVWYRTIINTSLNFSPSSLLFLLGPTDNCLDYSRQFQVGRSYSKMSVKSLVLRQLEEKCSLLKSRMERTSRLIQQHRDTYAELYEEREEVKRALDIMKSLPSIGPINHHIPKLGDVCEVCARVMKQMTIRTRWTYCTECRARRCTTCSRRKLWCCSVGAEKKKATEEVAEEVMQQQEVKLVHTDEDTTMVDFVKIGEQQEEAEMQQEEAELQQEGDEVDKDIDIGEEFFQFDSPASPDNIADRGKLVMFTMDKSATTPE
ncbi:hypothetical protein TSAR_005241 [Trichomalopsis sarcophagae]|uniref:Uncharacterized protein n=1 Tax=Trichomalopsis sarcophagae TaxID=543379 RepID=A0A232EMR6_9HYME|nr:hypothetical protein TSAR_005241 [Trichomalopsis sarcophagae]